MEAESPQSAQAALSHALETAGAAAGVQLRRVADLIAGQPDAWATVRAVIGAVEHKEASGDPVAHWASLFDKAVRLSPEGSVALYSLGSAEILAAATAEIVALLRDWGLLGRHRSVLDVGCGIGRLEAALAPLVASIVAVDIAPGMIAEARARCAGLANVRFVLGSGRDLAEIADGSIDLVTIVDTFPYLVLSGGDLAARHVAEAARALRPGGDLVILNLSYRNDLAADIADLSRFGDAAGLQLKRAGERPCRSWDAPAFHLVKT